MKCTRAYSVKLEIIEESGLDEALRQIHTTFMQEKAIHGSQGYRIRRNEDQNKRTSQSNAHLIKLENHKSSKECERANKDKIYNLDVSNMRFAWYA